MTNSTAPAGARSPSPTVPDSTAPKPPAATIAPQTDDDAVPGVDALVRPNRSPAELAAAYETCRLLARRQARNFYYSFLVLPEDQRLAMCALYTFLRLTDDIGDGDEPVPVRRRRLDEWRGQLDDALFGGPCYLPWQIALADAAARYRVEPAWLHAVVDGVVSDLDVSRYETFDDLYDYSHKVASVVGLSCIRIWGAVDPAAVEPAHACGQALQLTNILRDVAEDHGRGRVYLPQVDLHAFGVEESELAQRPRRSPPPSDGFLRLMRFQIDRAHAFYDEADALTAHLPPSGRAVLQVMVGVYRGLLRKIERDPAQVLERRVSLAPWTKMALLLWALPTRYAGGPPPSGRRDPGGPTK
ncbi:MAG: squalene/phytoene synthase family protein [Planctomycetia bacterium]